jgi:hypothetical protein
LEDVTKLQDSIHLEAWHKDENWSEGTFCRFKVFDDLNWLQQAVLEHDKTHLYGIAKPKFDELVRDWASCSKG